MLSDSIIDSSNPVDLPLLSLPFLQGLILRSPMSHISSYEEDTWLGLFSVLNHLSAPSLDCMVLRGSVHQILAAMMRTSTSTRPSNLMIDILSLDGAVDQQILEPNLAWFNLGRLTITFPESEGVFLRISPEQSATSVCSLLFFAPRTCSIRISTGERELFPLGLHHTPESYRQPGLVSYTPQRKAYLDGLRSLAASIAYSCGFVILRTGSFTESVAVEGQELVTKSLNGYQDWQLNIPDGRISNKLAFLVDIRCLPRQITDLIANYELESLRSLTLCDNQYEGAEYLVKLASTLIRRADTLPHLITISIEYAVAWRPLIELLGSFGKPEGRGISTLNVPFLPHPSILQEIVSALNSGRSGYSTDYLDRNWEEYERRDRGTPGCWECFRSRWTCFGTERECTRFSRGHIVSITKSSTWLGIDG